MLVRGSEQVKIGPVPTPEPSSLLVSDVPVWVEIFLGILGAFFFFPFLLKGKARTKLGRLRAGVHTMVKGEMF